MAHAKIVQPSKAARLLACPGSAALEVGLPADTGGAAADRGTQLHEAAEQWIKTGVATDEEVRDYVEWVQANAAGADLHVEVRLDVSRVTREPGGTGTADAVIIDYNLGELTVADLKTGRNPVSPELNTQLMIYAAAALERFDEFDALDTVRLVIVQPFAGGVKEWRCSTDYVREWVAERADSFERIITLHHKPELVTDADFNPGEDQCKYCPAARWLKCKALDRAVFEEITDKAAEDIDFDEFAPTFDQPALGVKYEAIPLIKAWIAHVEQRMLDALMSGEEEPGYYLGKGKAGNRKWKDEKTVAELNPFLYSSVVMSPTEAEKLKKAKKITAEQWAALQDHIIRAEGGPKVCKQGSDEPAFNEVNFGEI